MNSLRANAQKWDRLVKERNSRRPGYPQARRVALGHSNCPLSTFAPAFADLISNWRPESVAMLNQSLATLGDRDRSQAANRRTA